jgi:hypothetical protein
MFCHEEEKNRDLMNKNRRFFQRIGSLNELFIQKVVDVVVVVSLLLLLLLYIVPTN